MALVDRAFSRGSSGVPLFEPRISGLLAIVGFVGMVHYFRSISDRHSRGRLRGPKRRKPVYLAGLRQIEPRAMMALVGAFPSASRGRH